jgi:hypothetical protein
VKAGAYRIAKRRYVSHTLRIKVRPGSFNTTLAQGDVVRVLLQRVASSAPAGVHDYLYEVDRIGKSRAGDVSLDLIHFPIDTLGRSLVALDVMAAVGGGVLLSTGKSGTSCDVNADDDETVPADDSLNPDDWTLPDDDAFGVEIPDSVFGGGGGSDGGGGGEEGEENPAEDLDEQQPPEIGVPPEGPVPGATLTAPDCGGCTETSIQWFRDGQQISGATESLYTLGQIDAGSSLSVQIVCTEEGGGSGCESEPLAVPSADIASGVDRSITATFNVVTNNFGGNRCTDGSVVFPGSNQSSDVSVGGFGIGFRIVRGSGFISQVCGASGEASTTFHPNSGILVQVIRADGTAGDVYTGQQSYTVVTVPEFDGAYFSSFQVTSVSNLTVTG